MTQRRRRVSVWSCENNVTSTSARSRISVWSCKHNVHPPTLAAETTCSLCGRCKHQGPKDRVILKKDHSRYNCSHSERHLNKVRGETNGPWGPSSPKWAYHKLQWVCPKSLHCRESQSASALATVFKRAWIVGGKPISKLLAKPSALWFERMS